MILIRLSRFDVLFSAYMDMMWKIRQIRKMLHVVPTFLWYSLLFVHLLVAISPRDTMP